MSSPTTEIAVTVKQIREKAIAVADGTTHEYTDPRSGCVLERETWFFLPLSQIEVDPEDYKVGDTVMVTAPDWLLQDKGLA